MNSRRCCLRSKQNVIPARCLLLCFAMCGAFGGPLRRAPAAQSADTSGELYSSALAALYAGVASPDYAAAAKNGVRQDLAGTQFRCQRFDNTIALGFPDRCRDRSLTEKVAVRAKTNRNLHRIGGLLLY